MRVLRQIYRGCTDLPHVGEHPGTLWLCMFLLMGGLAGGKGGLAGFLGGTAFMALFMLPIYLYGAYDRANYSDQLEEKAAKDQPPHGA